MSSWVLLGPPGSSWVLLGLPGSSFFIIMFFVVEEPRRSLGPPGSSWVFLGLPGSSWVFLGLPGSSWVLLGPPGSSKKKKRKKVLLSPPGSLLAHPGSSGRLRRAPPGCPSWLFLAAARFQEDSGGPLGGASPFFVFFAEPPG